MTRIDIQAALARLSYNATLTVFVRDDDPHTVTRSELTAMRGQTAVDPVDALLIDALLEDGGFELLQRDLHAGPTGLPALQLEYASAKTIRALEARVSELRQRFDRIADQPQPAAERSRQLAAALLRLAGGATADDAAAVARELARLPPELLRTLGNGAFRVSVCRDHVAEYQPQWLTLNPRGWPPGMVIGELRGTVDLGRRHVVIATDEADGQRRVPPPGAMNRHGAYNLVLHETLHAYHHLTKAHLDEEFIAARALDLEALPPYERQMDGVAPHDDHAGLQETFAETGARFFGGDPTVAAERPHLCAYFQRRFGGAPALA